MIRPCVEVKEIDLSSYFEYSLGEMVGVIYPTFKDVEREMEKGNVVISIVPSIFNKQIDMWFYMLGLSKDFHKTKVGSYLSMYIGLEYCQENIDALVKTYNDVSYKPWYAPTGLNRQAS